MHIPKSVVAAVGAMILLTTVGVVAIWSHILSRRVEAYDLVESRNASEEQLVSFLNSSDDILLDNALSALEFRKAPGGREQAAKLLAHPHLYVWYCASLYLGAIGDQRSVPYLIRGLDHPAWRSRPRVVSYLKNLTGMDFGEKKEEWIKWWLAQQAGRVFDFKCNTNGQVTTINRR
jgi:hypothetical protein